MQSRSKLPVSREIAQALIDRHLGGARITGYAELTEGFYNAAYRIDLNDGHDARRSIVLKVAPPPDLRVLRYERDILRSEVDVLRLVAARTDMPAPAVLFHDAACDLLPSPCFAMPFIAGQPLHTLRASLAESDQQAIDRACGGYLRMMNAICGDSFGMAAPGAPRFSAWRAAFDHLLADVLQDGEDAGVALPLPAAEILALARRHYPALDEVAQPALVHWDLWDGNIFVDAFTREVTGIIDFERALWADPLMEVNFGAFGFNPAFLEGYGLALPFTPAQQARRYLYNLYLFLIMVIECTYRQYPTHDQENWSRVNLAETIAALQQDQSIP